jgi:hypothetical protein
VRLDPPLKKNEGLVNLPHVSVSSVLAKEQAVAKAEAERVKKMGVGVSPLAQVLFPFFSHINRTTYILTALFFLFIVHS